MSAVGAEPNVFEINCANPDYEISLIKAMNWYSLERDKKDVRKYLSDLQTKIGVELNIGSVPDSEIQPTMGWLARIVTKGGTLKEAHNKRLQDYIAALQARPVKAVPVVAQKVSVQEATQNKINEYLGELEGVLDQVLQTKEVSYQLLADLKAREMPQQTAISIVEWAKGKLKEFIPVIEGKDPDLVEGYSNYDKKTLKLVVKMFTSFIEDAEKYGDFKKANRKPRQKKAKPAAAQVKSLKYKIRDNDLGIASVPVTEIIGAMQVWAYNTKTRKLALYRTESASGIQCKGSTLQNYDPEMSMQKTLRKPEEQLKALLAAGKVQLRKYMDSIKAKDQKVTGRFNTDTIIVKVVK